VDVFKVVYDIEGRLKWDGVCTEYKVIDAIKDDKFHTEVKPVSPTSFFTLPLSLSLSFPLFTLTDNVLCYIEYDGRNDSCTRLCRYTRI
jgi:hypothetical protein